jgi:hypothetical protein
MFVYYAVHVDRYRLVVSPSCCDSCHCRCLGFDRFDVKNDNFPKSPHFRLSELVNQSGEGKRGFVSWA